MFCSFAGPNNGIDSVRESAMIVDSGRKIALPAQGNQT